MTDFSWSYPPIVSHLARHADSRAEQAALVEGNRVVSYGDLVGEIRRGAATILARGVRPGDCVVVAVSSKIDFCLSVFSAMAAGAEVAMVSLIEERMAKLPDCFNAKLTVSDDPEFWRASESLFGSGSLHPSSLSGSDPGELADIDLDRTALIILTSGTTSGIRRGVKLSHRNLSGTAEYINDSMGVDSSIRELVTAPLEHGFGFGRVRCILHAGGTVVLRSGPFLPYVVSDAIDRFRCNAVSMSASGLSLVLRNDASRMASCGRSLKWMEIGTGRVPAAEQEWLAKELPRTRVFLGYGMTEAIRSTLLEVKPNDPKAGTVGKPPRGVTVRVMGPDGSPAPPGQAGSIQVKGLNVGLGYLGDQQAWASRVVDGWWVTGDVGSLDTDGYLTYVGRTDDMINVGGLKVAPEDVEAELAELMSETPFAVGRIPDHDGVEGEVPGLFVEQPLASAPTLDTVRSFLKTRVPSFKIPRAVIAVPELPRTPATRKIRRAALAELYIRHSSAAPTTVAGVVRDLRSRATEKWPAVLGARDTNRKAIAELLEAEHWDAKTTLGPAIDLEMIRDARPIRNQWLENAVNQLKRLYPLEPETAITVGFSAPHAAVGSAILLHALASTAACVLLPPELDRGVAAALGWIQRERCRYAVVDSARLDQFLGAEDHLHDTFKFDGFRRFVLVGARPTADRIGQFIKLFGVSAYHLSTESLTWREVTLTDSGDLKHQSTEEIWERISGVASEVFVTAQSDLSRRSSPATTPGWDSLGFLRLILETEAAFGIALEPGDLVAVRTLGDLEAAVARKRASFLQNAATTDVRGSV